MNQNAGKSGQQPSAKRTGVLVVHGIGNQRALETVRGVATAVLPAGTKPWVHPEKSGIDVDLSVLTANDFATAEGKRSVDFHELYWAHLMSETRAIAVILWLFELVRKGPLLKDGMNALWWGAAAFVCSAVASVTFMAIHLIQRFAQVVDEASALVLAPVLVVCATAAYASLTSFLQRAWTIALYSFVVTALLGAALTFGLNFEDMNHLTYMFFPALASFCVVGIAMGRWGLLVLGIVYIVSNIALMFVQNLRYQIFWDRNNIIGDIAAHHWIPFFTPDWQPFWRIWHEGWIVWSMTEHWSLVVACSIVVLYFALNALFLQSYLGDAARYFRNSPGNVAVRREIRKQAVATLEALHESGLYDRIVVVAHSLGTVIAYDMLRSYFSRICNDLPDPADLSAVVGEIDQFKLDKQTLETPELLEAARTQFRILSRSLVDEVAKFTPSDLPEKKAREIKKWFVTDFVTLGSALTHARYLMCIGNSHEALAEDFLRRVEEREFPTCPPEFPTCPPDGPLHRLLFEQSEGKSAFHHGGIFGFTRWTNLYFPLRELFWGDAIGGPLSDLFGPFIVDRKVRTIPKKDVFFSHTYYWDVTWPEKWGAPHIEALDCAVDLAEKTAAGK